ncbi:hypothetical protein Taro_013932 [Colocasia esculenta]|uniref:Uncharacterized protein n=1 Tax=Colocasia esculenta TaxID=4460 RepID=A0A843UGV3_COLES|nr:hypothetical protein [Colocasia esculenta]
MPRVERAALSAPQSCRLPRSRSVPSVGVLRSPLRVIISAVEAALQRERCRSRAPFGSSSHLCCGGNLAERWRSRTCPHSVLQVGDPKQRRGFLGVQGSQAVSKWREPPSP